MVGACPFGILMGMAQRGVKYFLILGLLGVFTPGWRGLSPDSGFVSFSTASFPKKTEAPERLPASAPGAPTVCTITLNSADEKKVFERELKPLGFRFEELVPPGGAARNSRGWFGEACSRLQRERTNCDVVLISGHFGGDLFFGLDRKSGVRLFMEDLQRHSCEQSCAPVLSNAAHVFLFGCNTLAGKEQDHRSRDEYIRVLRADGVGELDAHRIADGRYGPYSRSFRDQMLRVFAGSGQLLGFDSVSPSGARLAPVISSWLQAMKKGGNDSVSRDFMSRTADGKSTPLAERYQSAMSSKGFASRIEAGLYGQRSEGLQQVRNNLCDISDESLFYSTRMERMSSWMRESDALAYLPSMQVFFRQWSPQWSPDSGLGYSDLVEHAAWLKLGEAEPKGYREALKGFPPGFARFQWGVLGYQTGWLSVPEGIDELKRSLQAVWSRPGARLDSDTVDYLCQVARSFPPELSQWVVSSRFNHLRSIPVQYRRLRECVQVGD